MITLFLFGCQIVIDLVDRRMSTYVARLGVPAFFMLIVVSWGFIQTSSVGTSLLTIGRAAVAPYLDAYGQIDIVHPVWLAVEPRGTLSADPIEGHHTVLKIVMYLALFWIAVRAGVKSARAEWMVKAIGVYIAALSVYGLLAYANGNNPILGEKTAALSASFVNRNSFATYAVFGVLINLAVLIRMLAGRSGEVGERALRRFLEAFLWDGGWLFALAFLICATALVASQSRGGALALAAGLAVMLAANHARTKEGSQPTFILVAIGLTFVVATSATGLLSRLIATSDEEMRFIIYGYIVEAIGQRPWVGHGLGSFEDAFRQFVPFDAASGEWDKAHNTYLELVFELGIPAATLMFVALLLVCAQILRGYFRRRQNSEVVLIGIGCLVAAGVHSIFDFSLQIPAIAAAFSFILGLSWIQSFSTRSNGA